MNYAWQERKRFAVPVAAGAAALLVWYWCVLSPINAAAERSRAGRQSAEMLLRSRLQAGAPREEDVQRAEKDQKRLQEELKAIRDDLEFRPDASFAVKEGQNVREKLGRQRQDVFSKIETRTKATAFPPIDSRLGFPSSIADVNEAVLAEWLARLAMVHRICMLAMDCGLTELKLVEVVPNENQDEPTIPADRFLGLLKVKFRVQGTAESIIKLCHGLQQRGPSYLAVEGMEITSTSPTQNLLGGIITAGALVVRPEGKLTPETKP